MPHLVYCDYIISKIKDVLVRSSHEGVVETIGGTKLDLDPKDGYLLSHKKTVVVEDYNGRKYRITVEDIS